MRTNSNTSSAKECNDNSNIPDSVTKTSQNSTKSKSLRALDTKASSYSSLRLQEERGGDGNKNLTFHVQYSGISKEEFESQFKLALERGELERILKTNLEESGNPAYLAFTARLSVISMSIETDEPQTIDSGSDSDSDSGNGGGIMEAAMMMTMMMTMTTILLVVKRSSVWSPTTGSRLYPFAITIVMLIMTCSFF
jgi:hypothetical protein